MTSGLIINGVKDALAAGVKVLETAQEEVAWLVPPFIHSLSLTQGFLEKTRSFIQQGGVVRGIVLISDTNIDEIRMCVKSSEDIRHSDSVHELFMYISDRQQSISAINVGIGDFTLDTPVTAFWTDNPTYAEYLLTSFESVWSEAVPAGERIEQLSARGGGKR